MTQKKLIILILTIASLAIASSCKFSTDKSKIADTMQKYVEQNLGESETFDFVGLSNHRDTIFMGVHRHCVGVIYTITDNNSKEKARHFADAIFSDDYNTVIYIKELDFDPIKIIEEKIKAKLTEKVYEKLGE